MAKAKAKPPATLWHVGRVARTDSGGRLFNAIHTVTGREYYGCPSYDQRAIGVRVERLNEAHAKPINKNTRANPHRVLDDIVAQLDGEEWNSDTTLAISEILTDAGYVIREPNEVDDD